ncbi:MAG: tellurite resistance/C4-dicarboxylate transporter family protein [Acidimicrobiales bacterium]
MAADRRAILMFPAKPGTAGPAPATSGPAAPDGAGPLPSPATGPPPEQVPAVPEGMPVPEGLCRRAVATLDPGYFAWVMATGIVSIGTDLLGYHLVSRLILGATAAVFVGLTAVYLARIVWFRPFVHQSLRDPSTAMAYFTVVAGTDVLGTRLVMAGQPLLAFWLGIAAGALWLLLTYALPWSIVTQARRPVLAEISGAWLIWVVATQSLSIIATAVTPHAPSSWLRSDLPAVAVSLWGLGVMLYVVLIVIIFLRLLLLEVTPAEMGPAYWIAMGATAISVRAAAGIVGLHGPGTGALVATMRPFVVGFSVMLWGFGTWWIPLLVLFGIWRYILRHYSRSYEPRLWSVVFPLGMYTVASWSLGRAPGLGFMASIATAWVWVGLAAWVAVLGLMGCALARALRELARPQHLGRGRHSTKPA